MGEYFVYVAKDTVMKVSADSLKKMDQKAAADANKSKLIAVQKKGEDRAGNRR